ncbi:nuclear transport factor 2 family protein [Leptospira kmetyi]|uniref:Nuclear transport factor 2 family protein n=1 Tax=Leptospira kmetyi TaxID=408139 RepID=A0A2M9XQR0_9LEPT|nr:nuclear transport factor 2 family protein [Leptospira kmetyi]AYV57750.1 nuclear transport factor 2 family protein [Leptospira kmetyi]EQA55828.1 SnoaL-like domain protein [Leptospira kmetyi serovar Malaysia str. Bejo-Iso9]PJZ28015.1 nuclear transport factor 2 family protein [Leptospira kmetyi]PJZ41644.1 nuclear transport factor 2 family protein [Leptospira kmetyi]TGK12967.1 nuclear transport factor 2 family protein [Leptospira kmetyi]
MDLKEAEDFCIRWLSSWTGNQPDRLIRFYDDEAFYSDPTARKGFQGKNKILSYFKILLRNNPNWIWTHEEIIPNEKGFVLKWKAKIPVKENEIVEYGMDIVEVENEKIVRNEVYFDTRKLMENIRNS